MTRGRYRAVAALPSFGEGNFGCGSKASAYRPLMGFLRRLFGGGSGSGHSRGGSHSDGSGSPEPPVAPKFDYELTYVPGETAVRRALALRDEWRGVATPIIIGTEKNLAHLTDLWGEPNLPSAEEHLELARQIDAQKWFAARAPELEEDPEFLPSIQNPGAWSTNRGSIAEFSVVRDVLSRKFQPWVLIAKIPTPNPYEVPAYLKYGGWNACPDASVHVAIWREWQENYGAEILCLSGDIIEATVARPPTEKEECYRLAREQLTYCEDIVTQGVGSIDALASILHAGRSWYFWWD